MAFPRSDSAQFGGHLRAFYEAAWRPALGWIATFAVALHYVLTPAASNWLVWHGRPALPTFDLGQTLALLSAVLGMAGLRTWEKLYGVATPTGSPVADASATPPPVAG